MIKLCIIATICVAFAFGRHIPGAKSDKPLRRKLDDMLVRDINAAANMQDMGNTMSQNTVDMASTQQQHGDAEIDPQKIFKMLQQFDVLLQNSETADRPENDHSPGQTEKQSTGSQDHNYPSPLPNQNSDNEPLDPEVPRIEQSKGCISTFLIAAQSGNKDYAGFSSKYMGGHTHLIYLTLGDGRVVPGNLPSPAHRNTPYRQNLNFRSTFINECVVPTDIVQVKLVAGGNDGWYIALISISLLNDNGVFSELTNDSRFSKWLDKNKAFNYPYDATQHILTLVHPAAPTIDTPLCGYGTAICECKESASKCVLSLEVDELMTFTSYQKYGVSPEDGLFVRGMQGVLYSIDEDSGLPVPQPTSRLCGDTWNSKNCTEPLFVDGSIYRVVFGVNGLIPGPTIVVHENQDVVINVYNNMSSEGISIHWHGMNQRNSPWMDGVGQITQCQIGPSSSYSYEFTASPSGSFWYHSHSGAQRTQAVYGAFIVRERPAKLARIKSLLLNYEVGDFRDLPGHSISFLEWQHESSLDSFLQLNAGPIFFPKAASSAFLDDCTKRYQPTRSMDLAEVGSVPFYSGLLNGRGRHIDVPYSQTRLSVFTVEKGSSYRFRLIGSQGLFSFKFWIDGHKLTVVATDGFWIIPKKNVDFIIVHSGERYDFILNADQSTKNYWIRAETLEINPKGGPPYRSLGNSAEGILQYIEPGNVADVIRSTEYEEIKLSSPEIQCSQANSCIAVNCPFKNFHPLYYTTCINVDQLQLLEETILSELPDAYPSSDCTDNTCLHFFNFNFEGDSDSSSVNGRNFIFPPVPPMTQFSDYQTQGLRCDLKADCNPYGLACKCTHVISTPYNKTVQIVLTAMGVYSNAHPIHLHGHSFFVVKVGYPDYDPKTGFVATAQGPICNGNTTQIYLQNNDIKCRDLSSCGGSQCPVGGCKPYRCTKPGWRNGTPPITINRRTVRKDTVMVPAGGYVVINIISNNPGYWLLHCHIEVHQLPGMTLVLNEAPEQQLLFDIPQGINTCGNYNVDNTRLQANKVRRRS